MDQKNVLLLSASLLLAFDQLVKGVIVSRLREGQAVAFGVLAIRRVTNKRVLGGPFRCCAALCALWTAEVTFFAAVGQFFQSDAAVVALGVALGGAGSNLLDRLYRDGVVDFIDFIDFGFWPVFNVADAAIVVGAVIGLINI